MKHTKNLFLDLYIQKLNDKELMDEFKELDVKFTGRLSLEDYWKQLYSKQMLEKLRTTLKSWRNSILDYVVRCGMQLST